LDRAYDALATPVGGADTCLRTVDAHQAFTGPGRVFAKIIVKFESSNDANVQTRQGAAVAGPHFAG